MSPTNRLAQCVSVNTAGNPHISNDAPSTCSKFWDDPLFGGISDTLFEQLEDPWFENIPDDFFEDLSDTDMSGEDYFGSIPDALFESISEREHSVPSKTSFLTLPPEIRNMIYDLVFVSPAYIGTDKMLTKGFFEEAAQWRNLAFARSCRQIYHESAHIFYAKNGFEFWYIGPMLNFMESIGFQGRRLLTRLRFSFLSGSPFVALRYLKSCESLKELSISIRISKLRHKNSWWLYPVKNVHAFVFTDCNELSFGEGRGFGDVSDAEAGELSKLAPDKMSALRQALIQVKAENPLRPSG